MTAKPNKTKIPNCMGSGQIVGSNEAGRVVRCGQCGFSTEADPRENRRSGGEVIPGWTMRVPTHKPGRNI